MIDAPKAGRLVSTEEPMPPPQKLLVWPSMVKVLPSPFGLSLLRMA